PSRPLPLSFPTRRSSDLVSRMSRLARTDASPIHAVHFCTHCGTLSDETSSRVCAACGLGVVLSCGPGVLPRAGAAFLVVKSDLRDRKSTRLNSSHRTISY